MNNSDIDIQTQPYPFCENPTVKSYLDQTNFIHSCQLKKKKKEGPKRAFLYPKNVARKTQVHRCLCWTDFHRKRQHTRSSRFPDLRLPIPGCFFHNARSDILRLLMLSHNDIMQDFLPLTVTGSSGTLTRFSFTRLLKAGT